MSHGLAMPYLTGYTPRRSHFKQEAEMLFTLSGPSGSGKTTLTKSLRSFLPQLEPLESVTTRAPRKSDLPGEYVYESEETFDALSAAKEFLWEVSPNARPYRYGTRKLRVRRALSEGLYLAILTPNVIPLLREFADTQRKRDGLHSLYLEVQSPSVLRTRLQKRGDSPKDIEKQLSSLAWNEESRIIGGFKRIHAENEIPYVVWDNLRFIRIKIQEALTPP